jgi:hypothetical protein
LQRGKGIFVKIAGLWVAYEYTVGMVLADAYYCRASRRAEVWMGLSGARALSMPEFVDIHDAVSVSPMHKEVASTG